MFEHKKVSTDTHNDISRYPILRVMLEDFGGLFAGGAAHAMHNDITIWEHLTKHETADIDLYFPNEETYKAAVEHVYSLAERTISTSRQDVNDPADRVTVDTSFTGLCHNVWVTNEHHRHNIQIQLVGCVFGSPREIVESFDFKNLEVGYYFKDNEYYVISSKNARNGELLEIRHTRSPFLMHRINKYIAYRGFKGVTNNSRSHITDWIIKASSGYYHENMDRCPRIYVNLLDNFGFKNLLKKSSVISDHDLVYMIGKIRETAHVYTEIENNISDIGYKLSTRKESVSIDVIIEEMKKRELTNGN